TGQAGGSGVRGGREPRQHEHGPVLRGGGEGEQGVRQQAARFLHPVQEGRLCLRVLRVDLRAAAQPCHGGRAVLWWSAGDGGPDYGWKGRELHDLPDFAERRLQRSGVHLLIDDAGGGSRRQGFRAHQAGAQRGQAVRVPPPSVFRFPAFRVRNGSGEIRSACDGGGGVRGGRRRRRSGAGGVLGSGGAQGRGLRVSFETWKEDSRRDKLQRGPWAGAGFGGAVGGRQELLYLSLGEPLPAVTGTGAAGRAPGARVRPPLATPKHLHRGAGADVVRPEHSGEHHLRLGRGRARHGRCGGGRSPGQRPHVHLAAAGEVRDAGGRAGGSDIGRAEAADRDRTGVGAKA
ncbi:unnamed protein product, partial [Ectocarpus fasciculatus]